MEIAAASSLDLYKRMELLESTSAEIAPRLALLEEKIGHAEEVATRVGALEADVIEVGEKADTVNHFIALNYASHH
jgi:hypothetical protein